MFLCMRRKRCLVWPVVLGYARWMVGKGRCMKEVLGKAMIWGGLTVLFAGCQLSKPAPPVGDIPPREVSILQGRLVVPAPSGYCVDQDSLKDHSRAGFVLIAGCDGLMGLPSGTMIEPAVLTVAALIPDQPLTEQRDIADTLMQGRVLGRQEKDGLIMIHLEAPEIVPADSAPNHWRGAMQVNGAVLTLAIYGNGAIAGDRGADLLQTLARQIRVASQQSAKETPVNTQKNPKNLFQRIFN